ncbi:wall-associated receptor kinase-like 20 [Tasmannia lanceolata]|uniref:wall-associated receptor kinase-like 20 n=1 Tax=Tasmannia lanceolata TaxID=3420 RepID=UPI0040637102
METRPLFTLSIFFFTLFTPTRTLATLPACQPNCGPLPLKYPLGTGYGCGSPLFYPSLSCANDQLLLTTHTGSYPITSLSYPTSTLTVTPPQMSTCSSMQCSSNFGLDWNGPFQLGPSLFILLSCASPPIYKSTPLCDSYNTHLCAALYTCPSIVSFGLPLFANTNSCCVYSPASLGPKGDLDLQGLKCAGYTSVVSLGDFATDPSEWQYGVALKYGQGGIDNYNLATACEVCERSDGVCGYAPPRNYFLCVCKNGANTSTDCYGQLDFWNSATKQGRAWFGWLSVMGLLLLV